MDIDHPETCPQTPQSLSSPSLSSSNMAWPPLAISLGEFKGPGAAAAGYYLGTGYGRSRLLTHGLW